MTSAKSRFGAVSPLHLNDDTLDSPWLNTYSRALCSLYRNEEDECWDILLSSQCSETLAEQQDRSSSNLHTPNSHAQQHAATNGDSSRHNSRMRTHSPRRQEPNERPHENKTLYPGSTLSTSFPREPTPQREASGSSEVADQVVLAPISPGGLSHAFCSLGFSAIDYFTASEDDQASADRSCTAMCSGPSKEALLEKTHRLACSTTSDEVMEFNTRILEDQRSPNADWAAAVCGKRTAALERKRVLSRTFSQENGVTLSNQQDPWFETLDRLSRWDEVAYR